MSGGWSTQVPVATSAISADGHHLHARAEQCTSSGIEHGKRIVIYRGDEYVLVGFYFAGDLNGHRELFYILRLWASRNGHGESPWSLAAGARKGSRRGTR
jgi:hypothetical protein